MVRSSSSAETPWGGGSGLGQVADSSAAGLDTPRTSSSALWQHDEPSSEHDLPACEVQQTYRFACVFWRRRPISCFMPRYSGRDSGGWACPNRTGAFGVCSGMMCERAHRRRGCSWLSTLPFFVFHSGGGSDPLRARARALFRRHANLAAQCLAPPGAAPHGAGRQRRRRG